MIRLRSIAYIMAVVVALVALVGCGGSSTTIVIYPQEQEKPTYTLMYYAAGGETLDKAIERSLREMEQSGVKENVKLTASVKWTKGYKSSLSNGEGEVCRFMLGGESALLEPDVVGDNSYALYDPDNIADFILWSKAVAPADNYILIIAGHGNGWHPEVGLDATRGTLRDTDLNRYTSLEELCEGIEMAGVHFRMVHMISCLMNNMEYITPLADYCDYILASSHISVMLCSEPRFLQMSLRRVKNDTDEEFVAAMKEYLNNIKVDINSKSDSNESLAEESLDFSLTDASKVAALNANIKDFTDALISIYDRADNDAEADAEAVMAIEEALAEAYYFISAHTPAEEMATTEYIRMAFTYDLVDIARRAAAATDDEALTRTAAEIESAAKEARLLNLTTKLSGIKEVYYGITLTNAQMWAERQYSEAGYEATMFDQRTGWSRFLKRNNVVLQY